MKLQYTGFSIFHYHMKKRTEKLLNTGNILLFLFFVFVLLIALRQLADPDLGFHLEYGKYIAAHHKVPSIDLTTTGASGNEYTDSQWLFQLLLYGIYSLSGYSGLSIFIVSLAALLAVLLLKSLNFNEHPLRFILLVPVFLLIENRLVTRPEVFSFIFIALFLLVLTELRLKNKNAIWLLPLLMLLWVNMHSLFITGIFILAVFFITDWISLKKTNKKTGIVFLLSIIACFINPYGLNMLLFPFSLLSRFSASNIFNDHIAEFQPFFSQNAFSISDYIFALWALIVIIITITQFKKLSLAMLLITGAMLILSFTAIRNIPLFAISSVFLLSNVFRGKQSVKGSNKKMRKVGFAASATLLIVLIVSIPGNRWYILNEHNTHFGAGIDKTQLPEAASEFILSNELGGNIINSLGAGGWLSWRLPQKVLIDGRLEVMGEDLYKEVEGSFRGELPALTKKYNGAIIVYNYRRYQPWTLQLRKMPDWKPVFIDGLFAVFIRTNDANNIPALNDQTILSSFEKQPDLNLANAGMFCLQFGYIDAADVLLQKASESNSDDWIKQALNEVKQLKAKLNYRHDPNKQSGRAEAEMHLKRGNDFFSQGKTEEAASEFRLAIQKDSTYAKAHNNLGNILAMQKNLEKALISFNKAIELDNNYADAYFGRGSCNYYLGKNAEACKDWKKAAELGNMRANEFIRQFCR